jgi:RNA polymerase sigma-70 factor, ECF subfamily
MSASLKDSENLLPRIARGDASAVQLCLQRYGGLVYSLVRRLAGTSPDAEDAVQEIFIEVWKRADRFDPATSSEVTFISMISRRKLIDRYRKTRTRVTTETLLESPSVDAGTTQLDLDDELAPVRKLLAQLPEEQHRVLLLAVCDGFSHQEVSDQTGLPLGTVKTYIRRGLMFLRDHLHDTTIGGPI